MRLFVVMLRLAAVIQVVYGAVLIALGVNVMRDGSHARWFGILLMVSGALLLLIAPFLWRQHPFAWWVSVLLVGGLMQLAFFFGIPVAVFALGGLGVSLVLGWPALWGRRG